MSNYAAYFLGILTVLIILIPFWYIATSSASVREAYENTVCRDICQT